MKKPKFIRQGGLHLKRLGKKWRGAKGNQSKLRMHRKNRGFLPQPGYGTPKSVRGLHPCGLKEILVHNAEQLKEIDSSKHCIRIAGSVGNKKRIAIQEEAKKSNIKILNPKNIEIKKK